MDTNAIYRTAKESFKLFCSLFFRLNSYHVNIEKQAQNMLLRLAEQIHKRVKIVKQLKKDNPHEWRKLQTRESSL